MELLDQLAEARTTNAKLEKEIAHLHADFSQTKQENENLECKMKKLEVNPCI